MYVSNIWRLDMYTCYVNYKIVTYDVMTWTTFDGSATIVVTVDAMTSEICDVNDMLETYDVMTCIVFMSMVW